MNHDSLEKLSQLTIIHHNTSLEKHSQQYLNPESIILGPYKEERAECKLQWIAVILQHEIQTPNQNLHSLLSKNLIVALELGYLKGSYVNFGLVFCCKITVTGLCLICHHNYTSTLEAVSFSSMTCFRMVRSFSSASFIVMLCK